MMMKYAAKFSFFIFLWIATATTAHGETITNESQTEECNNQNCEQQSSNNVKEEDNTLNVVIDPQPPEPAVTTTTTSETDKKLGLIKINNLWKTVWEQQGDKPFGNVLDAGTGINSMHFIATLVDRGMTNYTAVTGSKTMHAKVQKETEELGIQDLGNVVFGNWFDEENPLEMKEEEMYDVILVDYLIGAMDAFSPYMQDVMLSKLVSYLKPGGRMYVIGLEPLPDFVEPDETKDPNYLRGANMICQMKHLRDSCVLLAGKRIYREFPQHWMERQFEKLSPEMEVLATKNFPRHWYRETFSKDIDNGRMYLYKFISEDLALQMKKELDGIERQFFQVLQTMPYGTIEFGSDYLVSAEKKMMTVEQEKMS